MSLVVCGACLPSLVVQAASGSASPTLAEGFSARARLRPQDAVFLLARDRRGYPISLVVWGASLPSLVAQAPSGPASPPLGEGFPARPRLPPREAVFPLARDQ